MRYPHTRSKIHHVGMWYLKDSQDMGKGAGAILIAIPAQSRPKLFAAYYLRDKYIGSLSGSFSETFSPSLL